MKVLMINRSSKANGKVDAHKLQLIIYALISHHYLALSEKIKWPSMTVWL